MTSARSTPTPRKSHPIAFFRLFEADDRAHGGVTGIKNSCGAKLPFTWCMSRMFSHRPTPPTTMAKAHTDHASTDARRSFIPFPPRPR